MSKPKQYANIPVGYVCIPVEEYVDVRSSVDHVFRVNSELKEKIAGLEKQNESLKESLESAEADRDQSRTAMRYWASESDKLKAENETMKAKIEALTDTVKFYQPAWEDSDQTT